MGILSRLTRVTGYLRRRPPFTLALVGLVVLLTGLTGAVIGGLAWREEEQPTLVMMHRMRAFARSLAVPQSYYGAARRLLRDKIAAHDIHFTGKGLDLGVHDERDLV